MTALEKAEVAMAAFMGKVECQRCHGVVSRQDLVPLFGLTRCRWCWSHMSMPQRKKAITSSIDACYDSTRKG